MRSGKHALARTRTATPCGTTPSRWRVYQFHHQGPAVVHLRFSFSCELLEDQYGTWCRHPIRIAFDCELSNTGATGLEPATSRVTVECSNQTELRPQHQQRTFSYWKPWSLPQPLTIARRGIEPLSAP